MTFLRRIFQSVSFYPLTIGYLAAVFILMLVVAGQLELVAGVSFLGLLTILLILLAMRGDVTTVHALVNSQRDELISRIEQLIDALHAADVEVPGKKGDTP